MPQSSNRVSCATSHLRALEPPGRARVDQKETPLPLGDASRSSLEKLACRRLQLPAPGEFTLRKPAGEKMRHR
jgi:hypothetical protein